MYSTCITSFMTYTLILQEKNYSFHRPEIWVQKGEETCMKSLSSKWKKPGDPGVSEPKAYSLPLISCISKTVTGITLLGRAVVQKTC